MIVSVKYHKYLKIILCQISAYSVKIRTCSQLSVVDNRTVSILLKQILSFPKKVQIFLSSFLCSVIFQKINKELNSTSSGPSTANRPSQLFFSKHLKIGSTLMRGHRLRSVYYITAQLLRSQYFLSPPSRVNGRESWRAASENRNLWRTVQKISRFVKTLGWQSRSR